jgi:hypothetical protein
VTGNKCHPCDRVAPKVNGGQRWNRTGAPNHRHGDFQSPALPPSLGEIRSSGNYISSKVTDINWWLLGAEDQRRLSMPLALSLPQFLDTVPQARSLNDTILPVRSKYRNQGMEMSLILRSNIRIDIQEKGEYLP